ncbi:hypothetical protein H8K38_12660 [Undibacterium sp. FT79W]|nr:hypothetical protein [Undibacterium sp. FT79W]MBC3878663.1 hypothetical protein [Undibacterium sp. FT79W]
MQRTTQLTHVGIRLPKNYDYLTYHQFSPKQIQGIPSELFLPKKAES